MFGFHSLYVAIRESANTHLANDKPSCESEICQPAFADAEIILKFKNRAYGREENGTVRVDDGSVQCEESNDGRSGEHFDGSYESSLAELVSSLAFVEYGSAWLMSRLL